MEHKWLYCVQVLTQRFNHENLRNLPLPSGQYQFHCPLTGKQRQDSRWGRCAASKWCTATPTRVKQNNTIYSISPWSLAKPETFIIKKTISKSKVYGKAWSKDCDNYLITKKNLKLICYFFQKQSNKYRIEGLSRVPVRELIWLESVSSAGWKLRTRQEEN